ncbi:MAG: hypothetical protein WC637_11675 [Victivallales bacterium]|jgi:conjugal transfer/entry exclusion protein
MAKYFNENGKLHPEYLKKITDLQTVSDSKYQQVYDEMRSIDAVLRKELDDAEKAVIEAKNKLDKATGKWYSNGSRGSTILRQKREASEKIMTDSMKTFNELQNKLDELDGTAKARRELAASCQKLDLQPEKLSLLEEIAKDEAESLEAMMEDDVA